MNVIEIVNSEINDQSYAAQKNHQMVIRGGVKGFRVRLVVNNVGLGAEMPLQLPYGKSKQFILVRKMLVKCGPADHGPLTKLSHRDFVKALLL